VENIKNKTIFISPLDWGLGHATRCVPIVRKLIKNNNKIILGTTSSTFPVFEEEFPDLEKINMPAYNIRYSATIPLWLKLLLNWRRISGVIREEQKFVDETIHKYKIDVVISDNRFGFHSKKARSIFMTHQVFLKTPFGSSMAQKINSKYILNFDELWIPDYADENKSLSGELSHGTHFHPSVQYVGPQSRLKLNEAVKQKYDYLFLISGPEPQRSIFQNLLVERSKNYPELKFALVSNSPQITQQKNIDCFESPNAKNLSKIINESSTVICRSGYSTLMDLHLLEKKELILVPTPGQSEQEYLAEYWKKNFSSGSIRQNQINSLNF
jgi:spore coat polysaccharide biosynthesis predicted glycosyltransferase SpsG